VDKVHKCNTMQMCMSQPDFYSAVVTCEIKRWNNYFTCNHVWNYFKITFSRRKSSEIISKSFQRHWTCWKICM